MTRILAIETAGETCSVALAQGDQIVELFEDAPRRQTERVLPMVQQLLADAQVSLRQLDAIAFGHGPGAFTGVRVAAAVTQGLAFSADLPVVGVSTLAACALGAWQQFGHRHVLAAFDARMGELYLGAYACAAGQVKAVLADSLHKPEALPALAQQDWLVAGSGVIHEQALRQAYGSQQLIADLHPHAAAIAELARPRVLAGETVSAEQAQPVYLRDQVIQGAVR
ncbi:MAG: tRNA (adenosine(37)-N6)-threonylcarbamoyltransferase complex dimerization subunit type 1 TsaB [Alcanivorax sp.]|nr:tRNA (adenosine(37)-N6)-threonylcarbamoyltransferase complex dimerization subunit type 1 TsaB [Alcanivorax sp.]